MSCDCKPYCFYPYPSTVHLWEKAAHEAYRKYVRNDMFHPYDYAYDPDDFIYMTDQVYMKWIYL